MSESDIYDRHFYDLQQDGSLRSARAMLPRVPGLKEMRSAVDVGCGVGTWLRALQELGVARVVGLDGGYVEKFPMLVGPDVFRTCDLEAQDLRSAAGPEPFDVALCLEVAEHLSPGRAASFVAELCRLSDLVVFSAAVPEQGGFNHINEQWPSHWSEMFAAGGFECFDILRAPLWEREDCEWWYIQNILLFARAGTAAHARLAATAAPTLCPMALIHPGNLAHKREEFRAATEELQHLVRYQPFGRDEGIRVLERKVDALRQLARAYGEELDAARTALREAEALRTRNAALEDELSRLRDLMHAVHASTSWRITAPLRTLRAAVSRTPE